MTCSSLVLASPHFMSPTMHCISRSQSTSIRKRRTSTWYIVRAPMFAHYFCFLSGSPREAAMSIARLANHRNPHVAILSLALLDTLVQSCGYPFHLQISTKEFLNELVRRFPERPPPFPGPVMSRILELIGGWKEGICTDSRWKEDLGNIRDMHRLLTFKGYRFRDAGRSSNPAAAAAAVSTCVSHVAHDI